MPEEADEIFEPETAHVLVVGLIGDAPAELMAKLDAAIGRSTRFRVAHAAGKLRRRQTDGRMTLLFFNSDPEAAMECAVETAIDLKTDSEIKVRFGIHSGPVERAVDPDDRPDGASIDLARRIMNYGDAGHILLSKRAALELAPKPRWNTHLYEIGDAELKDGEKISLVNFYTDWAGNREEPSQLRRVRAAAGRHEKLRSLGRKFALAAGSIAVLAVAAGIYLYARNKLHVGGQWTPPPPDKSIAVLPLVDLSPARDQEYLGDGISAELREMLGRVAGLRVIAETSSLACRGNNADAREIGRRLNVATVFTGSLQRDGDRIQVTTQLVNAQNGLQIHAETLDQDAQTVFMLPGELARSVVHALRIKTGDVPRVEQNISAAAYEFLLQGLFFSNHRGEEDLRHSIELFQLALAKEPRLARAWSEIARAWISLGDSHVKPLDAYPRAENAAAKALALDDHDAEAHAYLGDARRVLAWDVNGEEAALKRALEINPNFVPAHVLMSKVQAALGHGDAQLEELAAAARLDPLSPAISSLQVSALVANDRLDHAFNAAKRTMEIDPNYIYFEPALALVYREQGKLKEALEIYERLEQTRQQPTAGLAITYARLGRKDDARRVLNQLIGRANQYYFPGEQIAAVYLALGDNDEVFRWIDRAIEERSPTLPEIAFAPEFRALRSDSRLAGVLSRIGIDPAKFK